MRRDHEAALAIQLRDLLTRGRSTALPGAGTGGRGAPHDMLTAVYHFPAPSSTPTVRRTVSDGSRRVDYTSEFLSGFVSKLKLSVRPGSWDDPSEGAFIEVKPSLGRLTVRNTADAHGQIEALLNRTFPFVKRVPQKSEYEGVVERVTSADPGEELVDMIRNVIEPDSWRANGGVEYIQVYQGSLVVRQSDSVHAELTRLLAALREPRKD